MSKAKLDELVMNRLRRELIAKLVPNWAKPKRGSK